MLDFILAGLQYGLTAAVGVMAFAVSVILLSPIILLAIALLSVVFKIGGSNE